MDTRDATDEPESPCAMNGIRHRLLTVCRDSAGKYRVGEVDPVRIQTSVANDVVDHVNNQGLGDENIC